MIFESVMEAISDTIIIVIGCVLMGYWWLENGLVVRGGDGVILGGS